jgi:hypothetical protein
MRPPSEYRFARQARSFSLILMGLCAACATSGPPRFWIDSERRLVVAGPLLGPIDNLETLGPRLCAVLRELPGAMAGNRRGGQEYCGVVYQRPGDERFYASYPSSLGPPIDAPGGRKQCFVPDAVSDPGAPDAIIYADYHGHPSITHFSPEDLQARRQRFYFRVMFNPICEVYLYDFQARTVFQLTGGKFEPIKQVADDLRGE